MINFSLIEKFLFPKIVFFYLRIFFYVINGLLELIGISLLLIFIKIISSKGSEINFYGLSIDGSNFSNILSLCIGVIIFYALKNMYNFWLVTSQHKILKKSVNLHYGLCFIMYITMLRLLV